MTRPPDRAPNLCRATCGSASLDPRSQALEVGGGWKVVGQSAQALARGLQWGEDIFLGPRPEQAAAWNH